MILSFGVCESIKFQELNSNVILMTLKYFYSPVTLMKSLIYTLVYAGWLSVCKIDHLYTVICYTILFSFYIIHT